MTRIVFFVDGRLCSRDRRSTALVDGLPSVGLVFVGVDGLGLPSGWSTDHVVALRVRDPDVFEGFGVLRLAGSRLISVDAVVFLARSSLVRKLFGSWWGRPGAIVGLLAQSGCTRGALAILRWWCAHLNVYW